MRCVLGALASCRTRPPVSDPKAQMTRSTPRRLPKLAVLAAMAVALPLTTAASSQAAIDEFTCSLTSGARCVKPRHALRAVAAWHDGGYLVGVGTSPSGSSNDLTIGGIIWGEGYSCKWVNGSTLYPVVANGAEFSLHVDGLSSYGTGAESC
jgi:hypothetical protein